MTNLNFIKTLTTGAVLALVSCPQVWAQTYTYSCGENCTLTVDSDGTGTIHVPEDAENVSINLTGELYIDVQINNLILPENVTGAYGEMGNAVLSKDFAVMFCDGQ